MYMHINSLLATYVRKYKTELQYLSNASTVNNAGRNLSRQIASADNELEGNYCIVQCHKLWHLARQV